MNYIAFCKTHRGQRDCHRRRRRSFLEATPDGGSETAAQAMGPRYVAKAPTLTMIEQRQEITRDLEPKSSTASLRYQILLSLVQRSHPSDPRMPIVRIAASDAQEEMGQPHRLRRFWERGAGQHFTDPVSSLAVRMHPLLDPGWGCSFN